MRHTQLGIVERCLCNPGLAASGFAVAEARHVAVTSGFNIEALGGAWESLSNQTASQHGREVRQGARPQKNVSTQGETHMARIRVGTLMCGLVSLASLAMGLYLGIGEELSKGEPFAVGASLGFLGTLIGILCWGNNRAGRATVGS